MTKALAVKDDHVELLDRLFMERLRDLGFTMVETKAIMTAHESAKMVAMLTWITIEAPKETKKERKLRKKKKA